MVSTEADAESRKGRFGWHLFEKHYIPFIYRGGSKYFPVRIVDSKVLTNYLRMLPQDVNMCHSICSYYMTDAESSLFEDINVRHCARYFGDAPFTVRDLIVKVEDADEFHKFLDLCYKKLVLKKSSPHDRCGFFRINRESVVPFTYHSDHKYVPLFFFEGETDHLKLKAVDISGWDLAYLRFCCKVQGIKNELFAGETCSVVALSEIKSHFPQETTFEDYWPAKCSLEPVKYGSQSTWPSSNNGDSSSAGHVRKPANPSSQQHHASHTQQVGNSSQVQPQPQLKQIKDFVIIQNAKNPPYRFQKALINSKIISCVNVRPHIYQDLMMTLPDFAQMFAPHMEYRRVQDLIMNTLRITLYKGNRGHREVLSTDKRYKQTSNIPLILVQDVLRYMKDIKLQTEKQGGGCTESGSSQPPCSKRARS